MTGLLRKMQHRPMALHSQSTDELLAIPLSTIKHLEEVLVPVSANSTRGCVLSVWL